MNPGILIVDDDSAISEPLQEFMELSGFAAETADSAEKALEFLAVNRVDVVITDILLTGMDGLQFTEAVKQRYDVDVIVMTGYSGKYSYEDVIRKGASDLVFKPIRFEELLLRFKRVLKERQLTRERVAMLKKLKRQAITDGLTGLYNSRHFYDQLEMEIDRCRRYNHPLALMLMDIDHFKAYNDAYGHIEGDRVLVKLGQLINRCLRRMDSAYRYGGEEFTVILPETTGEEAVAVASRISEAVKNNPFALKSGATAQVTISTGITAYLADETVKDLVARADQAMYISKHEGRNCSTSIFNGEPPVTRKI